MLLNFLPSLQCKWPHNIPLFKCIIAYLVSLLVHLYNLFSRALLREVKTEQQNWSRAAMERRCRVVRQFGAASQQKLQRS